MTDPDALLVRGTPQLLADLKERDENGMDSRKLTDYAVAHGVELPEFYTPDQLIGMAFTEEGEEIGLSWEDPDDRELTDPPWPPGQRMTDLETRRVRGTAELWNDPDGPEAV